MKRKISMTQHTNSNNHFTDGNLNQSQFVFNNKKKFGCERISSTNYIIFTAFLPLTCANSRAVAAIVVRLVGREIRLSAWLLPI